RHRSNRGEKLDVAGTHRSENVKHKHQDKPEGATDETRRQTGESSEDGVHCQTSGQGCKYERVGNAAVANVVVGNDDRQWDQENYLYDGFGHFTHSSVGLHLLDTRDQSVPGSVSRRLD